MKPLDLSLYLVTDQRISWDKCLIAVRQAILGGVTLVQLREKNKSKDEIKQRALDLLSVLNPMGIPLIINDHVDIAREVGAQGVHLGKEDYDVKHAKQLLGPDAIIGLSIETVRGFERSNFEFCDYVSASPVFPTATKENAAAPMGLGGLKRLRSACPIPLVAIGGIESKNADLISASGVDGICVVSSILCSPSPESAARSLREAFESTRKRKSHG
jgi:thiamine-phosphate pyrophosphorylase